MVIDLALLIDHSHVHKVVPVYHGSCGFGHFVSIRGEYLPVMELKLHIDVIEHLLKHVALVQIN